MNGTPQDDMLAVIVRKASRALARHGLVHAYGHCSARINSDRFLVSPANPLGMVGVGESCVEVSVNEPLPDHVLGEVRLHQQIYRSRPEAGGVVRFMGPKLMSLAALGKSPEVRHGFGTYFAPRPPLWDDPQLIRDDQRASAVISMMGTNPGILMRGNGAVVAGENLQMAVVLAWYLEDACRIELDALATGLTGKLLDSDEAHQRATKSGRIFERMWNYLTTGDDE